MSSINVWNADLYDDKLSFVSIFGKGVVELLQPKRGEKILDLGCGTGDLSYEISHFDRPTLLSDGEKGLNHWLVS